VVERGERLGLALEACQAIGVGRHLRGQHLERDLPLEPGVLGQVNLAHPALAE
jgi:hypothetical protein